MRIMWLDNWPAAQIDGPKNLVEPLKNMLHVPYPLRLAALPALEVVCSTEAHGHTGWGAANCAQVWRHTIAFHQAFKRLVQSKGNIDLLLTLSGKTEICVLPLSLALTQMKALPKQVIGTSKVRALPCINGTRSMSKNPSSFRGQ